jgi:hypothetical protein
MLKRIFIIIFLIITILFTVGYASQPLFRTSQVIKTPEITNIDYSTNSSTSIINNNFYIGKFTTDLINSRSASSFDGDYTNLNNDLAKLFQILLYTCIAITIGLVCGILLTYFGLKMISKILFFIILILMIAVFIIMQVIILTDSFIKNVTTSGGLSESIFSSTSVSNGNGYFLILTSTILMFITYIIYAFLG